MGEDFLRKKAKRFKKLQSKSYQNVLKRENLFSKRQELLEREFYGDIIIKDTNIQNGKILIGMLENGHMKLLDGENSIGKIVGNNIQELKAFAEESNAVSNSFNFIVTRISRDGSTVYLQLS